MKQVNCVLLVVVYLLYSGKCQVLLPPEMTEMGWILFPDGNEVPHLINLNQTEAVPVVFDVDKDVTFQLYTRSHPATYTPLKPTEDADVGDFSNQRKTSFIIHGWTSNGNRMKHVRKAYLEAGDYNVIVVDWSKPASSLYPTAKNKMKVCGDYLAKLIDFLVMHHGLRHEDVHIIGHSLGAHLAGVAGNRTKTGKPGKITGLDPAAPLFGYEVLENRLDKTDAQFVEVIHTCAGLLGWMSPMGHADFYPNDGTAIQPGCGLDLGGSCSHGRSHKYFAESITTSTGFVSLECSSWKDYKAGKCSQNSRTLMGEFADTSSRGSYYLRTARFSPYALGDTSQRSAQKKLLPLR